MRIQNRLYEIADEPTDSLFFSVMSELIGNGLEEQIKQFKSEHAEYLQRFTGRYKLESVSAAS